MRCFLPKALSLSTFKRESKNLCHSGNFVLSYYCSLHVLFGSVACRQNKDEVKIPWINGPIPVICHSSTKTCLLVTNKQTNKWRQKTTIFILWKNPQHNLDDFFLWFFFFFLSLLSRPRSDFILYQNVNSCTIGINNY